MTGQAWRLGHRPALDGLRAVAFLAVFGSHAGIDSARGGGFGVLVFFVLSGFLITALLLEEHDRTGTIGFRRFYRRRALRLFPAAALAFTATALVLGGPGLWSTVFYAANWQWFLHGTGFDVLGFYGHAWSLSVEEQFYMAWPVALLLLLRRGSHRAAVSVLVAAVAGSLLVRVLTIRGADDAHLLFGTHAVLDQLAIGALLAFAVRRAPALISRVSRRGVRVALPLLAALLVTARPESAGAWGVFSNTLAPSLAALATAILIGRVITGDGRLTAALSWSPLTYLGRISYGMYLWHILVIALVPQPAVALCLIVAVSAASFRYVETPLRHGRAWTSMTAAPATPPANRRPVPAPTFQPHL